MTGPDAIAQSVSAGMFVVMTPVRSARARAVGADAAPPPGVTISAALPAAAYRASSVELGTALDTPGAEDTIVLRRNGAGNCAGATAAGTPAISSSSP